MKNKYCEIKSRLGNFLATLVILAALLTSWQAGAQPSTNGLLLWLDAGYPGSIQTNAGGSVIAWQNLAPGGSNAVVYTGNNDNNTDPSYNSVAPTYLVRGNGVRVVNFTGNGYLDNLNFSSATPSDLTVFLLASASTNLGSYAAWMAFSQSQTVDDYQTGLNIDQGQNPTATFSRLNVEGAKAGGGGGFQFANGNLDFGTLYLVEVDDGSGPTNDSSVVNVLVEGVSQESLQGSSAPINLDNCFIGTRSYTSGFVPNSNHDLIGQISAVLVYDYQLTGTNLTQTQEYLENYFLPPALNISPAGTNMVLVTWPDKADYNLQTTTNLAAGTWTQFSGSITSVGGTNNAAVTAAGQSVFFRLAYP